MDTYISHLISKIKNIEVGETEPYSSRYYAEVGLVFCPLCKFKWMSHLHFNISRKRICVWCKVNMLQLHHKRLENIEFIKKISKLKNLNHHFILEIGLHPDRIFQTQLADTLHLFATHSTTI